MEISKRGNFDVVRVKSRTMNKSKVLGQLNSSRNNAIDNPNPPRLTVADRMKRWPFMVRKVMGHSMVPVLPPQTKVYGWRWFRKIKPGDVVVFRREGRETIKRVERYELDRLFVLGDHADTSTDSRHFGAIPEVMVVAKVIWPRAKKQPIF